MYRTFTKHPKRNTASIRGSNWKLSDRYLQNCRIRIVQNVKGMFGQKLANRSTKQSSVVLIADGNRTITLRLFRKQKNRKSVDCAPLNSYQNLIGLESLLSCKRSAVEMPATKPTPHLMMCHLLSILYIFQRLISFSYNTTAIRQPTQPHTK